MVFVSFSFAQKPKEETPMAAKTAFAAKCQVGEFYELPLGFSQWMKMKITDWL